MRDRQPVDLWVSEWRRGSFAYCIMRQVIFKLFYGMKNLTSRDFESCLLSFFELITWTVRGVTHDIAWLWKHITGSCEIKTYASISTICLCPSSANIKSKLQSRVNLSCPINPWAASLHSIACFENPRQV